MSTVKSLYHIVINTKNREMTIPEGSKRALYAYIYGIIRNQGCTLIRMNGIGNHIHMLLDLSTELSLSQFMREMKRSSSIWLKSHPESFPAFKGWVKSTTLSRLVSRKRMQSLLISRIKRRIMVPYLMMKKCKSSLEKTSVTAIIMIDTASCPTSIDVASRAVVLTPHTSLRCGSAP